MIISGAQLRAARGHMEWSRTQCGRLSGVSAETIKNIENESFNPTGHTVEAIVKCFADRGIEFIDSGVRKKPVCSACGAPVTP